MFRNTNILRTCNYVSFSVRMVFDPRLIFVTTPWLIFSGFMRAVIAVVYF
ncbi:hypothetical protein JVU11DRAFT_9266 [Chiua virens]|nr:hypothetical protein JVU11DRAFT_9261 [Chiua virens]KAG9310677.1 hypothetical protein JVU11DRAFT_9266 [Chiua virens]